MSLRGQRFELDLEADDFTPKPLSEAEKKAGENSNGSSLINDILERNPTSPPTEPQPQTSPTGFPAHKKRSKFATLRSRQNGNMSSSKVGENNTNGSSAGTNSGAAFQNHPSDRAIAHHVGKKYGHDFAAQERQEIDKENKQRIAEMSQEDIEEARAELMSKLNPALIERLLKRATIDDVEEPQRRPSRLQSNDHPAAESKSLPAEHPRQPEAEQFPSRQANNQPSQREHEAQPSLSSSSTPQMHFPPPPNPTSKFHALDPLSPSFPTDLHATYFPTLPQTPSSMTWLQPPSASENTYNPTLPSHPISTLRFSFVGDLITPNSSLTLPTHLGLHHHGAAPESAGYTIPELGILVRSTFAPQRCLAYRTVGRLLFRLGRGEFGPRNKDKSNDENGSGDQPPAGAANKTIEEAVGEEDDSEEEEDDVFTSALWDLIEDEHLVEIMMGEANRGANGAEGEGRGHASARAYALEGLWLWRRGREGREGTKGGRERGVRRVDEAKGDMQVIREEEDDGGGILEEGLR